MFSIIIPAYNAEKTISRAIKSVLNQTFISYEIIVVNDGSTDETKSVIQGFLSDTRINLINQVNNGVSVARNRGIIESRYEWICLLDADDAWLPEYLDHISKAVEAFPDAVLYGSSSYHVDLSNGNTIDSTVPFLRDTVQSVDVFANFELLPHTSAITLNKKALELIDDNSEYFPNGMLMHQDWALFMRLALIGHVVYIGIPLTFRYNNVSGQVTGLSLKNRKHLLPSIIRYYNLVFRFYVKNDIKSKYFLLFLRYKLRSFLQRLIKAGLSSMVLECCLDLDEGLLPKRDLYIYGRGGILATWFINCQKLWIRLIHPKFMRYRVIK